MTARIDEKFLTTAPKKAVSGPKTIPTKSETATKSESTSVTL
jgi:hypothetical protein